MCGLFKTTCIMTVLSVTICLIILHFTTGLKVLPTGDQTNGVGTTVTINKVNGLAWTVLAIANATENALSMINDEMRHLREAVIQNRLVLDLLTAEKGGVCKMLGVSCCFNIPDHSDNITDVIEHMRKAVQEPEPANDQWLTWIMNLEGGWGMWLAQTVFANYSYSSTNFAMYTVYNTMCV